MEEKVIRSNCGIAVGGCGIFAHVRDGQLVKVEGDPECPSNKGTLCSKGFAAPQIVYHPDRLKYPMKRVGQRGEGKWQRISWDEALDTIADNLKRIRAKYGPLGVAVACGTGRPEPFPAARRFLNAWGSPNRIGYPHNCYSPVFSVGGLTFGRCPGPDMEHSNCLVIWGNNLPDISSCKLGRSYIDAFKRGARTICIDPYFTPSASKADIWLQVRPGTDCALALAWLNVIVNENLYDKEFVGKWTHGFNQLMQHVKQCTPEWAEQITWVPADKIRQAARMYATIKPACLSPGVAIEFGVNTTNTVHAFYSLSAVTGNVDILGGDTFFEEPVSKEVICGMDMKPDTWDQSAGDFPLLRQGHPCASHSGWRAALHGDPYPIRGVLSHSSNAIVGHENSREFVYKAIMSLDFFEVMDQFMTPTAELADIVLPATTSFERDEIHPLFSRIGWPPLVLAGPKVIEPLWECRNDSDVYIDILNRVGLDFGATSNRDWLDKVLLKAVGFDFEEFTKRGWISLDKEWNVERRYEKGLLRSDGKVGFETPSGKIELYSSYLEEIGHDPLPVHKEPPESPYSSPELTKDYPFVLTTGIRSPVYFHTTYRQVPWLREIHPDPIVRINLQTGEKLGINDGDWVWIESPRGRCKQRAMLTLGLDQRVVLTEHDWWFPEKPAPEYGVWESNVNLLTDSEPPHDPCLGSSPARSLLCKIYKAEGD